MVKFQLLGQCPGTACIGLDVAKQLYCEQNWLENRQKKEKEYLTKFRASIHFHDSLPYSSVVLESFPLILFSRQLYFHRSGMKTTEGKNTFG